MTCYIQLILVTGVKCYLTWVPARDAFTLRDTFMSQEEITPLYFTLPDAFVDTNAILHIPQPYWSFDPHGMVALSSEQISQLCLPTPLFHFWVDDAYWQPYHYLLLHQSMNIVALTQRVAILLIS
jgi:hypothetical protein